MARESVEEKGRRYLVEGRLEVTQLDSLSIEAECRGDGAVYSLGHNGADWWCSCPARGGRCAHLHALRLVTVRPGNVVDDPEPPVNRVGTPAVVEDEDDEDEGDVASTVSL